MGNTSKPCKYGHPVGRSKWGTCLVCLKLARAKWRDENRQRELDKNAEWRKRNRGKHRRLINSWKLQNKGRLAESVRFRQARKKHATPPWLSLEHRAEMKQFYTIAAKLTRAGFPTWVDHIIPLSGKRVCGLHVPWNLQLLTPTDNMVKGSKFP